MNSSGIAGGRKNGSDLDRPLQIGQVGAASREAYETLLQEVIEGSTTLFMRTDLVQAAWDIVEPVLQAWREHPATGFPNYAAGTWGPAGSDLLLARDGRAWYNPMPGIADACGA